MKKQRNIFMYLWAALLLAHKSLDGREEQEQPLRSLIEEAYQQQKKITTQLLSSIEEKTKEQEAQVLHKTEMLKKIADKKYEELKEEAHSEISLIKKVAQEGISSITKAVEKKSQQIQGHLDHSIKNIQAAAAQEVLDLLDKTDEQVLEQRRAARQKVLSRVLPSPIGLHSLASWKSKTAQECNQSITLLKNIVLDGENDTVSREFIDQFNSYQRWFDHSLQSTRSPEDRSYQELLKKKQRLDDLTAMQKKADLILERYLLDGTLNEKSYKTIRVLVLYELNSRYAYHKNVLSLEEIASIVKETIRSAREEQKELDLEVVKNTEKTEDSLIKSNQSTDQPAGNITSEKSAQIKIDKEADIPLKLPEIPELLTVENRLKEIDAEKDQEKELIRLEAKLAQEILLSEHKSVQETLNLTKEKYNRLKEKQQIALKSEQELQKIQTELLIKEEQITKLSQELSLAQLEKEQQSFLIKKTKEEQTHYQNALAKTRHQLLLLQKDYAQQELSAKLATLDNTISEKAALKEIEQQIEQDRLKTEIKSLQKELLTLKEKLAQSKNKKSKNKKIAIALQETQIELFKKQEELSSHEQALSLAQIEKKQQEATLKKFQKKRLRHKEEIEKLHNELSAVQLRLNQESKAVLENFHETKIKHSLELQEKKNKISYQKDKIALLSGQIRKKEEDLSQALEMISLLEEKNRQHDQQLRAQEQVKNELVALSQKITELQIEQDAERKKIEQELHDKKIEQLEEKAKEELYEEIMTLKEAALVNEITKKEEKLTILINMTEKMLQEKAKQDKERAEEHAHFSKKHENLNTLAQDLIDIAQEHDTRETTLEKAEQSLLERTINLEEQQQSLTSYLKKKEASLNQEIKELQELTIQTGESLNEKAVDQEILNQQIKDKENLLNTIVTKEKEKLDKKAEKLTKHNKELTTLSRSLEEESSHLAIKKEILKEKEIEASEAIAVQKVISEQVMNETKKSATAHAQEQKIQYEIAAEQSSEIKNNSV